MELTTQLRELREKRSKARDASSKMVVDAETEDRSFTPEEKETYDGLVAEEVEYGERCQRIERKLGVNEYSETLNDPIGLTAKESKQFSMRKLINAMANPENRQHQEAAAFELECSNAVAEKRQSSPQGQYIPNEVWSEQRRESRAVHQVANESGNLVETALRDDSFIELLRNRSAVITAGAMQLPNLVGDMAFPRQLSASTASWQTGELTDIGESEVTIDQVAMTPRTVGVHTSFSRKALLQTTPGIDTLLSNDMRAVVARAIDSAALYGTGAGGQPTGLVNATGIGSPADFAAATPTWVELMLMVREAAIDNALVDLAGDPTLSPQTVRWLMGGGLVADLMATEKFASTGQTIISDSGSIGPWGTLLTNQVTDGDIVYGDFSEMMVGTWGGLDIIVDPYSQAQRGSTRVVMFQSVDIAFRHAQAFVFNNSTA